MCVYWRRLRADPLLRPRQKFLPAAHCVCVFHFCVSHIPARINAGNTTSVELTLSQGDLDAPSNAPCSRCRREGRECVVAPSRRGGNNKRRREDKDEDKDRGGGLDGGPLPGSGWRGRSSMGLHNRHNSGGRSASASVSGQSIACYPPGVNVLNPSPKPYYLFNDPSNSRSGLSPFTGRSDPSPVTAPAHLRPRHHAPSRGARPSPPPHHEKRLRLHLNPLDPHAKADPSSLLVADMQNESDALQILALETAGEGERGRMGGGDAGALGMDTARRPRSNILPPVLRSEPVTIKKFALIRLGIVEAQQATTLIGAFFRFHHHLFVSRARLPRELAAPLISVVNLIAHGSRRPHSAHDRADCRVCAH